MDCSVIKLPHHVQKHDLWNRTLYKMEHKMQTWVLIFKSPTALQSSGMVYLKLDLEQEEHTKIFMKYLSNIKL